MKFMLYVFVLINFCTYLPASDLVINIQPEITHEIGGYSHVQNIFSVMGGYMLYGKGVDAEIKALNLNGDRQFIWPHEGGAFKKFNTPKYSAPWAAYLGEKNSETSRQEAFKQWKIWFKQDFSVMTNAILTYAKTHKIDQMDYWKFMDDLGISQQSIVHLGRVNGIANLYPEDYCRYIDVMFKMMKKHYSGFHADLFQITNEPDYLNWAGQYPTVQQGVNEWIRLYDYVQVFMHKKYPKTQMIGPCLSYDAFCSIEGFETWTKPILKGTREPMKYYNNNLYDLGAETFLGWVETIQAQAEAFGRPRPREVVTELNYDLGSAWNKIERFRFFSQYLFSGLENPDKIDTICYFLLAYRSYNDHCIFHFVDGKPVPNNTYWLYWVLSEARGRQIYATPSGDSDIRIVVTAPADNKLVANILNDSPTKKTITINSGLDPKTKVLQVTERYAYLAGWDVKHGEDILPAEVAPVKLELSPGGVYRIMWTLDKSSTPKRDNNLTVKDSEIYAATVAKEFSDGIDVEINPKQLPESNMVACLRLGVMSDNKNNAQGLTITFNGNQIPVSWSESRNEMTAKKSGLAKIWRVDIPLQQKWIKKTNFVHINKPDVPYRLMFMSLIFKEYPTVKEALKIESLAFEQKDREIIAWLKPVETISGGERKTFSLIIRNRSNKTKTYKVQTAVMNQLKAQSHQFRHGFYAPNGPTVDLVGCPVKLVGIKSNQTVEVAGNSSINLSGTLTVPDDVEYQSNLRLKVFISEKNGGTKLLSTPVVVLPKIEIVRLKNGTPHLDGKLDEWSGIPEATMKHGNCVVKTRLSWDETNLYAAIEVNAPFRPMAPKEPYQLGFRHAPDGINFLLDLGNQKRHVYDDDDLEVIMFPVGIDSSKGFGMPVWSQPGTAHYLFPEALEADPRLKIVTTLHEGTNGYTSECAIPWNLANVSFIPRDGMRIGFDIIVSHREKGNKNLLAWSVFKNMSTHQQVPATWSSALIKQ